MSTITTTYNGVTDPCCALVIEAIQLANSNVNAMRPVGALMALMSPENRGTFRLNLDPNKDRPTAGSFRKVYTKDIRPVCDQDTDADDACALPVFSGGDDIENNYVYAEHEIDLSIKREIDLDLEEFQRFCTNPTQYIADKLLAFRSGVWEEINAKTIGRIIAYQAAYENQSGADNSIDDPINVSFLTPNSAGGFMFDPTGYSKLKDEYAKLGYAYVAPIIVGGSQLSVLQSNSAFMGGTNVNGVTSSSVPNLYVDYGVDTAFADGDNHLLTWKQGALQLVNVNAISDAMVATSALNVRERSRVTSPFGDGLTWDYYFDVAPSGCEYKIKFQAWFDVIQPVPYDETCAKAPVLHFLTGCTANTCPDSGSGGSGI